jgi:integrase
MTNQRSYGTGSLVERPPGSGKWYFRYVAGRDPMTGKVRRRAITFTAKNKTAARVAAQKLLSELDVVVAGSTATVTQLLDEWMSFQESRGRSPTTLNGYRSLIDHHISPAIGSVRIEDLSAHQLDTFYRKISNSGKSPRTVRNIHAVLSAALNQGVRWEWLAQNPAGRATLPEASPTKIVSPSIAQAQALITECQKRDEVLGAFVLIAAVTGCRRGEVAALRWSSIQDDLLIVRESVFTVKGEVGLKSTKSGRERVIHIDPAVHQWLQQWRARCELVASQWGVTIDDSSFILSSRPDGVQPVALDSISHQVRKVANEMNMPLIHLHSLRHFAATELLAAGVTANDAAEMLGHADASLTLRVYAHATSERQKSAARVLANVFKQPTLFTASDVELDQNSE